MFNLKKILTVAIAAFVLMAFTAVALPGSAVEAKKKNYDNMTSEDFVKEGDKLYVHGKYRDAGLKYIVAIAKDADNYEAQYKAGLVSEKIGNYDEAGKYYEAAIKANDKYMPPYKHLADVYVIKRDFDKALEYYNKFIEKDQTSAEAYGNRAIVHLIKNNTGAALADTEEAIRINPNMYSAWYLKATAADTLGYKKEAVGAYERFIELAPHEHSHLMNVEHAKERIKALK